MAYESELTGFLRQLKQEHPEMTAQQKEGRALWWDGKADADDLRRWQDSSVRRGSYVYYKTSNHDA